MLSGIDLTEQKWRILRVLDELGEVEQSTISKEACLFLSSLTRTLRSMEQDGQISRRQDTEDKRRTLVQITDVGREILSQNMQTSIQIYHSVVEQMGQDKIEQLLDLLQELQSVDFQN